MASDSLNINAPSGRITLTIPLTITISLGSPQSSTATASPRAEDDAEAHGDQESLTATIRPDDDYDSRPGYDPRFLGFEAPLPTLSSAIRSSAAEVNGSREIELKYHHYSVIMNKKRRLAFVAAVNYDAGARFKQTRVGKDKWFLDPRLSEELQADGRFYTDNPFDRGHIVRRADAAWGNSERAAKIANDDTFHWTNCSPQHEVFNQSTQADRRGVLLWGNIEEHIADQATKEKKKVTIFNGPIFRDSDRKHRGLQVPKEFWKIVVFRNDAGDPRALGFVLSQDSLIKNVPAEDFEVGPYRPFQVKISTLESRTKLSFGPLAGFDPLAVGGAESFLESDTGAVGIGSLEDIVL